MPLLVCAGYLATATASCSVTIFARDSGAEFAESWSRARASYGMSTRIKSGARARPTSPTTRDSLSFFTLSLSLSLSGACRRLSRAARFGFCSGKHDDDAGWLSSIRDASQLAAPFSRRSASQPASQRHPAASQLPARSLSKLTSERAPPPKRKITQGMNGRSSSCRPSQPASK